MHYDVRAVFSSLRSPVLVADDHLRLVFTQIDPSMPEREFTFDVKVDESDIYQGVNQLIN